VVLRRLFTARPDLYDIIAKPSAHFFQVFGIAAHLLSQPGRDRLVERENPGRPAGYFLTSVHAELRRIVVTNFKTSEGTTNNHPTEERNATLGINPPAEIIYGDIEPLSPFPQI